MYYESGDLMDTIIRNRDSIPTYMKSNKPFLFEILHDTNFEVGCHRLDYYAICFLTCGELSVETNIFRHHAKAPSMFVIAPEVIRKFMDTEGEMEMKVLFFRKEYFLKNQVDVNLLDKYEFFEQKDQHVIPLSDEKAKSMDLYYKLIEDKIQKDSINTGEIIRSYINILLNEIDEVLRYNQVNRDHLISRNEKMLLDFKVLASRHFIKHRQLSFYADKLNITSKYLSTVVKSVSGKTASEWIKDMILLESKVLLRDSKISISEVASRLEFTDLSHFGKFFKTNTGMSPLSFRKNQQ